MTVVILFPFNCSYLYNSMIMQHLNIIYIHTKNNLLRR